MDLHSAMTFTVPLHGAGCDEKICLRSVYPGASGDYFKHFGDLVCSMASKPTIASHRKGSKLQHSTATLVHGCYEERKELLKSGFTPVPAHRFDLILYRNADHKAPHDGAFWSFY